MKQVPFSVAMGLLLLKLILTANFRSKQESSRFAKNASTIAWLQEMWNSCMSVFPNTWCENSKNEIRQRN